MSGSSSSRSRPKRKLEPISLEELAGTTGMSGFGTLFTRDLSQNVPVLDDLAPFKGESSALSFDTGALSSTAVVPAAAVPSAVEDSAPVTSASTRSAPSIPAPIETAVAFVPPVAEITGSASSALVISTDNTGALESSAAQTGTVHTPGYRFPKIRPAATVEEGHSLAEHAIYLAMYRAGKPYQGEDRILTTGLRTLAERVRMAYANCKANVRSLLQKLAIEEYGQGFSYTTGRTYIVYNETEVLKRRRAAGLTHVIRTRGVAFVHPQTGLEITRKPAIGQRALE